MRENVRQRPRAGSRGKEEQRKRVGLSKSVGGWNLAVPAHVALLVELPITVDHCDMQLPDSHPMNSAKLMSTPELTCCE